MIPEGNDLASYSVNIEEEHFILSLEDKEGNVDCFEILPRGCRRIGLRYSLQIDDRP